MKISKILIVNPFGIGDVLFSTPLLKAIKKKYPSVQISYICNKRAYGVLRYNPHISNIYIFEKDDHRKIWNESKIRSIKTIYAFISNIRKEKYDLLIDMSLGYIFSLFFALLAGIRMRVGFNYRDRGRFLTHKIDLEGFNTKHVIEYYLDLGKYLDLDLTDKEMVLAVSAEDMSWADKYLRENGINENDRICGIIPGCGASWGTEAVYRRWSPWKFAEAADYVADKYNFKILIFGEEKERAICLKTALELKAKAIQVCGKTTLTQFAALINRCNLVITNDGGPLHMAVALKRKTVSIFGPVDERIYGPYPPSSSHIVVTNDETCRPCYRNFKHEKCGDIDCLKNIKPSKVLDAVERLIGNRREENYIKR